MARTTKKGLVEALTEALGDSVQTDVAMLAVVSNDVYRTGGAPLALVRPSDVAGVQAAVRLCAEAGVAMVPRGGGASYTDGYLFPKGGHVLFDMGALDSISVNETNLTVTVGAGATWAALKDALDAKGLRTPFWGPFSGLAATVGGSMSQNTLSHGSNAHGISAQSVMGMDVVLANGDLLRTNAAEATRFYGPDLTGLFTGDCGALGLKVAVTMPLIRRHPSVEALSFAFDSFEAYHAAVRVAAMERLDDSHFGLDLALSQGQIGRNEGAAAKLKIAADVIRKSPDKLKGIAQVIRMGLAGEDPMRSGAYMCHFIVDGYDASDAAAKAKRLRRHIAPFGREIANTIPAFVAAMPFAPLANILGPCGERWVPLHAVLSHEKAVAFNTAFHALLAERKAEMAAHGVWTGTMFSPAGPSGFLYEVAIYWPDDRTAYHHHVLGEAHMAALPTFPDNPPARAYADDVKQAIIALMQDHGAGHFQIGRAYPYLPRLDARASALVKAIKAELDPKGLMNPGALGL